MKVAVTKNAFRSFSLKRNEKMYMERSYTFIFTKQKHKNDHGEVLHVHFHQTKQKNEHGKVLHFHFHQTNTQK